MVDGELYGCNLFRDGGMILNTVTLAVMVKIGGVVFLNEIEKE